LDISHFELGSEVKKLSLPYIIRLIVIFLYIFTEWEFSLENE